MSPVGAHVCFASANELASTALNVNPCATRARLELRITSTEVRAGDGQAEHSIETKKETHAPGACVSGRTRRLPTFSREQYHRRCSLDDRVRNGNGYGQAPVITGNTWSTAACGTNPVAPCSVGRGESLRNAGTRSRHATLVPKAPSP